ncbi:formate-tetrahydrofolate ligase [Streptococcus dysgalactiae subsp. equisimilis 167]|nr:formate-tetrahydrofolate ligase [Streptococcus dysgalactiae subsp. equisimilis 167]
MVLSDIEIANSVTMEPISKVADQLGIDEEALCLYGKYKAKIDAHQLVALKDKPDGKLILVTAISPTPAGEGKTTTSVGLVDALSAIGKKQLLPFVNLLLVLFLGLREELLAVATRKLSQWKTSTSTLQGTFMLSVSPTTY